MLRASMKHYIIDAKIVPQKMQETYVIFYTNFHVVSCTFCMSFIGFRTHPYPILYASLSVPDYSFLSVSDYSFLIAAKGLNFIALREGKKPATMPTRIANTNDKSASHGGI